MVYLSVKGLRQWPSLGQSAIRFITTCVCSTMEAFIKEMAGFRQRQRQAVAAGTDLKKFPLRDWYAQMKWSDKYRDGPPMERLESLLCTVPVFTVGVTGPRGAVRLAGVRWVGPCSASVCFPMRSRASQSRRVRNLVAACRAMPLPLQQLGSCHKLAYLQADEAPPSE